MSGTKKVCNFKFASDMGGKTVAVPPASEVFVEGLLDPPVSVLARLISEEAMPIDL